MTREEALAVLGLAEGASEEEIKAAHRRLIQRMHPDAGGTADLAARINRAKDVLLGGITLPGSAAVATTAALLGRGVNSLILRSNMPLNEVDEAWPQRVRKAVLPVAGLGTRFLPATKAMPKEMLTVVDRPLIQYAVEECLAAGIEEFVFVTGRNKSAIEDHFDAAYELEATLEAARQKKAELKQTQDATIKPGNADLHPPAEAARPRPRRVVRAPLDRRRALRRAAARRADDQFADAAPAQLVAAHEKTGGNVVAVMDVPREQTKSYGIAAVKARTKDGLAEITGLVEKPKPEEAPSTLASIGRYVLQPEVFDHLDKHETGAGGEIQLTDAMASMIGQQPFHALRYRRPALRLRQPAGFPRGQFAVRCEPAGPARRARTTAGAARPPC